MNNEFIIKEIIRFFEDRGFWCQIETDQTPVIKITLIKPGFEKVIRCNTLRLSSMRSLDTMYADLREDFPRIIKSLEVYDSAITKLTKPVENKNDGLSAKVHLIDEIHGVRYGMVQPVDVIFNGPATIVFWNDGTKTIVKCSEGDEYDPEKGLAMAYSKKLFGNKGNYCKQFKKWLPKEEKKPEVKISLPITNVSGAVKAMRKLNKALKKGGRGM